MCCNTIAGKTFSASLKVSTSLMKMSNISFSNAASGLTVAVKYVSRNPDGFASSNSRTRPVKFVMRIVDATLSMAVISWKIGGLTIGFAYCMSVLLRKVEL